MSGILVTGANGHLGRRLIRELVHDVAVTALVRSERAKRVLLKHVAPCDALTVVVANPCDVNALIDAARGCTQAVHLIGTIRATRKAGYEDAHERPAGALLAALAQTTLKHIVTISILGASPASLCACLRSRVETEQQLLAGPVPVSVLRVPMVLGEKDRASTALRKRALAKRVLLFRADCLEQPIYAGDVIAAMRSTLNQPPLVNQVLELAGPISVTRRELIERAAGQLNRQPAIYSLPLWVGMAAAALLEFAMANPPVTRDMLRLFDHDDAIDAQLAARRLAIELTPLTDMLARCIDNQQA
jgi:uncharacterized protein YbjT (DUF2867 family)